MRSKIAVGMLLAASLLTPSVGYVDYRPQFEQLKTRLGTVRVVRRDPDVPGLDNLMVNGEVILESDLYVGLYGQFQTRDGVAVLFGENQGGHNWLWDLSFVLLRAQKKPVIVTAENFSSADGTVNPRQQGDDVIVDLGFESKQKKTAKLHGGKLVVELRPAAAIPVREETCRVLHENSSDECIERGKRHKAKCEREGKEYLGYSGVVMTDVTILSHHPGFMGNALTDICTQECKSGTAVPYELFKNRVCSIR